MSYYFEARLFSRLDMSQGQTCPSTSRLDLSQGRTCPNSSRQDLSQHFRAGLVSRPDLSQHFEAGLVPAFLSRTCQKHFRDGHVQNTSRLDLSRGRTCPRLLLDLTCPKTLRLEVSKSSGAGSDSRLVFVQGRTCLGAQKLCSFRQSVSPLIIQYKI